MLITMIVNELVIKSILSGAKPCAMEIPKKICFFWNPVEYINLLGI